MNKKRSVFIVIIIVFIVIIMPIYMLSFGLYQWGYTLTNREIVQSMYTRSTFFMNTLENEIRRVNQVLQECLNDDDLYYYANAATIMTMQERVKNLLAIQKRLDMVYDSFAYIADVILWMPQLPHMISAQRGVDPMQEGWESLLQELVYDSASALIEHEDELYLCAAYPVNPRFSDILPAYILAIRLSSEKIAEEMLNFNMYPGSGTMFQLSGNDFRLLVGNDIGLDEKTAASFRDEETGKQPALTLTLISPSGDEFLVIRIPSTYLNGELYTYVPKELLYGDLEHYRLLFILFTIVACVMVGTYFWFTNRIINRPIKRLVAALTRVERGQLDVKIKHGRNDEFGYLYETFNQMVVSLNNMLEINIRQRTLTQEADLRQLQAQINPHFLHNSFYILYRMAKDEDYENITQFLTYLSDYYRYITRNAKMEVELRAEDGHARHYMQIQLVRFRKRLSAVFEPLPEAYAGLIVPRLILQPLLENAFNHGLQDVTSNGFLHVWYEPDEITGALYVQVEDNGPGLTPEEKATLERKLDTPPQAETERTGIINIHQRVRARFGERYGLSISSPPGDGVRFTLTLPLPTSPQQLKPEEDCREGEP